MFYFCKFFLVLVVIIFTTKIFAFTWITPNGAHFPVAKVTLNVANNNCPNAGVTAAQLLALVHKVPTEFWNKVSTANLQLVKGIVTTASFSSFTDGASSAVLTQAIAQGAANTIIIGCSNKPSTTFSDGFTAAIGGISSATDVRGAVVLNDNDSTFANLTENQKVALLAHEIGHALGLGHSKDPVAVMYYSLGTKIQERLTRDDFDGLTSLYPHKSPGGCGSIAFVDHEKPPWNGLGSLILGAFLAPLLMNLVEKIKRRTTLRHG